MTEEAARVALVTGGGRGIGKAVSTELSLMGFAVVVNYQNNEDAANATVAEIEKRGGKAIAVQSDVADAASVKAMFKVIHEALGPISILVNNAGVIHHAPLTFMSDDDWSKVVSTNLTGTFNCTREVVRDMMKSRWGRIVNISSDAGRAGETMASHYSASKAGVLGLTKANARELARYGVTVNALTPGFIETDMTAEIDEGRKEKQLASIPAGRFGKAEEVASLVGYLCSEKAAYITGQSISVNGGLVM